MTVREVTGNLWYSQYILIVPRDKYDVNTFLSIKHMEKVALFAEENWRLESVLHKYILDMEVQSYGCMDDNSNPNKTWFVIITKN